MKDLVFVGGKGNVVALDRATGSERWRAKLKGADFVNVVLDGGELLATTKGEIFCLDPSTGHLRWQNELKGLGYGFVAIAGGSAQQHLAAGIKRRQEQAAAAASATAASSG